MASGTLSRRSGSGPRESAVGAATSPLNPLIGMPGRHDRHPLGSRDHSLHLDSFLGLLTVLVNRRPSPVNRPATSPHGPQPHHRRRAGPGRVPQLPVHRVPGPRSPTPWHPRGRKELPDDATTHSHSVWTTHGRSRQGTSKNSPMETLPKIIYANHAKI